MICWRLRLSARDNVLLAVKMITAYYAAKAEKYTAESYRAGIERVARVFYDGGGRQNFNETLRHVIRIGLRDAFILGGEDIGIPEEEFIQADWDDLTKIIEGEQSCVASLADFIREAQGNGTSFDQLSRRFDSWGNRFTDVRNQAKLILGKDEKLEWVYGDTEHCDTCARLNGKVKRASVWAAYVQPRNPPNAKLDCGGWRCQCELMPTDKPVTRGRLP